MTTQNDVVGGINEGGINYGEELSHLFNLLSMPRVERALSFAKWCHGRATAEAEGVSYGLR